MVWYFGTGEASELDFVDVDVGLQPQHSEALLKKKANLNPVGEVIERLRTLLRTRNPMFYLGLVQGLQEEVETLRGENLLVSTQYQEGTLAILEAQREVEESRATIRKLSCLKPEKFQKLRDLFKLDGEANMKARLSNGWMNEQKGKVSASVARKIREFSNHFISRLLSYECHVLDMINLFDVRF